MKIEWIPEKFRYDGDYSRDIFKRMCMAFFSSSLVSEETRYKLAVYVGWADGLSNHERIRWGKFSDGSVVPYVVRGNRVFLPDGESAELPGGKGFSGLV